MTQVAKASASAPARSLALPTVEQIRNQPTSVTAAQVLSQKLNMTDPATREAVGHVLKMSAELRQKAAWKRAEKAGLPTSGGTPGGGSFVLQDFDGERPVYHQASNVKAAITTTAYQVRSVYPGFPVDGSDPYSGIPLVIGMWEAGATPRYSHQEFDPLGGNSGSTKIIQQDGSIFPMTRHATHVAATLVGTGETIVEGLAASLRGMASGAYLDAYDSTNDAGEMILAGAFSANPTQNTGSHRLYVSNHSYNHPLGWINEPTYAIWTGAYTDNGTNADDIEERFGLYDSESAAMDGIVVNCPYYLPFFSAGDERIFQAPIGVPWYVGSTANEPRVYVDGRDPAPEFTYKSGYDTMPMGAPLAKNIMTVGAVTPPIDPVTGERVMLFADMGFFSSWGPADDGRIKPDIVADGHQVLSASHEADDASARMDGTSMAAPNACGSALLLQQLHMSMFAGPMPASMLKALIIHTADDVFLPDFSIQAGPDYKTGWGVMNTKRAADTMNLHRQRMNSVTMTHGRATSGGRDEIPISLDGSTPLRVTLCWIDPPGTPKSTHDDHFPDLVNNLQLEVRGPDGTTTFRPYVMPYVGNWSQAALSLPATTGVNNVDTVEQVYIDAPAAGDYTVAVYNASLTHDDPQDYSLVITGDLPTGEIVVEDANGISLTDDESALSLGALPANEATSAPMTVTIRNVGPGFLQNLAVTVDGAQAGSFTVTQPLRTTLDTDEFTTFQVTFIGAAPGAHVANLHVQSNDRDERPFDIQVVAFRAATIPSESWRVSDQAGAVMVGLDPAGNVITAGTTYASNLDTVVTKRSVAAGATLWQHVFTTEHGGGDLDEGLAGMKVDSNGDVVTATGAYRTISSTRWYTRSFITKLSGATGQSAWSNSFDHDEFNPLQVPYHPYVQGSIDLDAAGNALVADSASDYFIDNHQVRSFLTTAKYSTSGDNMWFREARNVSPYLYQRHSVDGAGNFLLNNKYDASEGTPLWAATNDLTSCWMHASNAAGNMATVTGSTEGPVVTQLHPNGSRHWSVTFDELPGSIPTGDNYEYATGVAIDSQGNVFVVGSQWLVPQGSRAFLAKFRASDGILEWVSHYQSGMGRYYSRHNYFTGDFANQLKLDSFGNPVFCLNTYVGHVLNQNTGWSYSPVYFWGLQESSSASGARTWERHGEGESVFTEDGFALDAAGRIAFVKGYPQVEVMLFKDQTNVAPTLTLVHDTVTVDEGMQAINAGVIIDPDIADTVTVTATSDTAGLVPFGIITFDRGTGIWQWSRTMQDGPDQSGTVFIRASDGVNAAVVRSFQLVVRNVAPQFLAGAQITLLPAEALTFQYVITFTDPGDENWFARADFGNGDEPTLPVDKNAHTVTVTHSFPAPGIYPFVVAVGDGDPDGLTVKGYTVIVQRLIADWRKIHFGTTDNTGEAADDADADGDGIPNLAEFAFNLDPKKGDGSGLPGISFGSSGSTLLGASDDSGALDPKASSSFGPGDTMTISFDEPPATTGIIYGAESSSNLTSWQPVTDTGTGGTHTFSVPVSTNTKLFMRLKVTTVP